MPPQRCSPLSLSHLLPSSYSTDHACSKNRSHFHLRFNTPHTPPPPNSCPCTTALTLPSVQIQSLAPIQVYLTIAPPRAPPSLLHHAWNLWAWAIRTSTNLKTLGGYKTLRVHMPIRSFCQHSTPELEGATLIGEGGGPRLKPANNRKVKGARIGTVRRLIPCLSTKDGERTRKGPGGMPGLLRSE